MKMLTNFMLGTLLAAILIGPAAWAEAGQAVQSGALVVAAEFGHTAPRVTVLTTIRSAFVRTP